MNANTNKKQVAIVIGENIRIDGGGHAGAKW
jgi:hypothetical protein